jgi:hypothetical protein
MRVSLCLHVRGGGGTLQAEFGKDKLRDDKDALKKLFDTSKQKLRALTSKVETSTKVVEKDKAERAEMEIEARKIKLYNSFGKQVRPCLVSFLIPQASFAKQFLLGSPFHAFAKIS